MSLVPVEEVIGGWDASHPPTEEGEEGRGKTSYTQNIRFPC
jgi:hypothetical protein